MIEDADFHNKHINNIIKITVKIFNDKKTNGYSDILKIKEYG